ncbi:MAG: pyruvate, phosphate dikinase [Bacillota bacterium]
METKRYVFMFEEGSAKQKEMLGGKGANLAEMTRIGLPVPHGFTISTEACRRYIESGNQLFPGLMEQVWEALTRLEEKAGKRLGLREQPLLVSVRSGAVFSMPGMMDTILNLGLNDETVEGLAAATGDRRFAYDCYRRFIQMFGNVVMKMQHGAFERILERHKDAAGVEFDHLLDADQLVAIIANYKEHIRRATGQPFPLDPRQQLTMAIEAVFSSWNNPRAKVYRQTNGIPEHLGTAVNVQMMIFGNMGETSGTGVVFTRDPSTGHPGLYGEFLTNAQGEDVVAGIRTPKPIAEMSRDLPEAYRQLVDTCQLLEKHYGDMQDIEFTVEKGILFLLQTRTGKRTAAAAVRIAHDLVEEGKIDRAEAVRRIEPTQMTKILHRGIDPDAKLEAVARGLPASPGAATGQVVFDPDLAEKLGKEGQKVILVRPETTPDDIHGIIPAQGILTSRGGMTCHAAIVARGMGKPCVCGCEALRIDMDNETVAVAGRTIKAGDVVSIDGATGAVYIGEVPMVDPTLGEEFGAILRWADDLRHLGVRANADTPEDARKAREFGAEGIGLCRTEHMFMAQDRLPIVQEMILAETLDERQAALDKLLPIQQGDFEEILEAMEGLPTTIRLLDPPLHEFLPKVDELLAEIALLRGQGDYHAAAQREQVLRRARALEEANPMLGFRGCRLGIVYPEIYAMQARAIFQATVNLLRRGFRPQPEVMIPLVGHPNELLALRQLVEEVKAEVVRASGIEFNCPIGTMIEVPRAALVADQIAGTAEFFSFGTNDLTQTTFGFSRDDAEGKFLHQYLHRKVLEHNPFEVLDEEGVGQLIRLAVDGGRRTVPGLKVGICGEHGGEPRSIDFCHRAGLNYVSCSPYRVPVARLAAAQAALRNS